MTRRYRRLTAAEIKALEEYARALQTAGQAVGTSPAQTLAWVQEFTSRDLSVEASRARSFPELRLFLIRHYKAWGSGVNVIVDQQLDTPLGPSDLVTIQQSLRAVIDHLAPDAIAWFSQPTADGLVWSADHGVSLVTRAHAERQALAALSSLLITIGAGLRRCDTSSCRRLFVRNRPWQTRCRPGCGGTERVRAWRLTNKARLSDTRHQDYVRKVQARLPGARVTRRRKG